MKPLCLLPLFAVLPAAIAEPAAHSAEYEVGMEAIARLREVNLAYVKLAAAIDSKAEAWMRCKVVTAVWRQVEDAVWRLHRLRCPVDIGEATALKVAFDAAFDLPDELRADLMRLTEMKGYGQFFWFTCSDATLCRSIANVEYFGMLATELDGAAPELREEYERSMAVVELIQQLDGELRGLTRDNLEARRGALVRLQAELVALPVEHYLHAIDPGDQMSPLQEYQSFMLNSSFYSLMVQYHLLREALPQDARLEALLKPLEGLYARKMYELHPAEDFRAACYGVPKDRW